MANQQPSVFDTFTDREAARMTTVMAELDRVPWAQGILHVVQQNGGLIGTNMSYFFELRFGHALHKAGIAVAHEVPGEGESTLDFGFTSKDRVWKVEMMRLLETDAAKAATRREVDEDGVRWFKQSLSSTNEDKKQSLEGETLKAVERICQKCERGRKPYKFPKPDQALQAILVDMRTFKNGGDMPDRIHIGLGGEPLREVFRMYWGPPENRQLISGVFGPRTKVKGAAEARERVHFIGFARERSFEPNELGTVIQFVANPALFNDAAALKAAMDSWPLQPAWLLNARASGPALPRSG
jgi:hypothetical protein